MRLTTAGADALGAAGPLVALLVDSGRVTELPGGVLAERAAGLLSRKAFKAERRKTLLLHAEGKGGPRALLLVGMGKPSDLAPEDFRRAAAQVVHAAADLGATRVVLGAAGKVELDADRLAALGEGAVLAGYRYPRRKAETRPPGTVAIASGVRGAAGVLATAQAVAGAANLARELGDLPGNVCTPRHLVDAARKVCREGELRCRVYDKRDLERMKMGGILAVNRGSAEPPFLIEMDYKPRGAKHTLCVVGKGLTFDSGGISIKPAASMEEMKYDMCGAAATIGLMAALARTRPAGVRVVGIVGTTENMPGGRAYKPGDVVTTASGKTIEVINTDAEGRIVLSDALHHATSFEPDAIVDLATLTGAIVVALGHEAAGLFCPDDRLARRLVRAGERTAETLWRMPTFEAYDEAIKSQFADIKNSAGRPAGACTAARFLFHFTKGHTHAHIDIAGAAWGGRKRDYYNEGASGFGVRLLHDAITHWND